MWDKSTDTLSINPAALHTPIPEKITKRVVLSFTHKIPDIVGVTCPVLLSPKLLLARLCAHKKDWDQELDEDSSDEFCGWVSELPCLEELEMDRYLGPGDVYILSFGDASGDAYAAAVYARVQNGADVSVVLLAAKSRLAPRSALKKESELTDVTIPRLELMAATILVRLTRSVLKSLTREVKQVTYWTDSTTVLAWITRTKLQLGVFVRNRVMEIRKYSDPEQWHFVPGYLNPADLPSPGCSPSRLVASKWWLGADWFRKADIEWPTSNQRVDENEIKSEVIKTVVCDLVAMSTSEFKVSDYFTSYTQTIRFIAWVKRFLQNRRALLSKNRTIKKPKQISYSSVEDRKKLMLTFEELREAEASLLKHVQSVMFDTPGKNKLSSFKVLLNEQGLRILKTKIFNRKDNFLFLCPIILDNNHDIVDLIIQEEHEKSGHAGIQIVMSNIREKFWIISLRSTVRSVLSKCITCKKQMAKHLECETPAPLPFNRVRDSAIFEVIGVDFAGPLYVKGGEKSWICIFTCAVYRAVHLELTTALSVKGFVDCLRRFISRRGRPKIIYSDNGTNFVGTTNAFNKLDWEKIVKLSSAWKIKWIFNPPSAPWWGGWWKRLIGILKGILRKILGKANLSYEDLNTTLVDAESVINSRPLTYISNDPEDLKPLSPSVFLQDIVEIGTPDCDMLYHEKLNKRFRYRQKILNDLRVRFRSEYLGQLVLKTGKKESREIGIGDVVLIGDDNHKRIDWPLARVVEEIRSRDGNVRVFVLKTKNGLLKRPIQRLYPLEIKAQDVECLQNLKQKLPRRVTKEKEKIVQFSDECYDDDVEETKKTNVQTWCGRVTRPPKRIQD